MAADAGREGARERHISVPRSARYYILGEPAAATRELWVACHGYGQLAASFARALEPLRAGHRLIAVPEALSRFYLDEPRTRHGPDSPVGASWMTREDREHEIADHVGYLDLLVAALLGEIGHPVPVTGLGFSQGVATVARWGTLGRTPLHGVVFWGGSLPRDLPFERGAALFQGAEVLFVAGQRDGVVPLATIQGDRGRLTGLGIDAALRVHDGGHLLSSAMLRALGSSEAGQ